MSGTKKQRQARRERRRQRYGSSVPVFKAHRGRCNLLYLRRGAQVRYRDPYLHPRPLNPHYGVRSHYRHTLSPVAVPERSR